MKTFLIVCPFVFLAGFVDAVSGGGGLISLPAYLMSGLPVHNAIATNKLSSSMGTTVATYKYAKAGYIPFKTAAYCIIMAIIGSSAGANIALMIDESVFRTIMLIVIPVTACYVLYPKSFKDDLPALSKRKTVIISAIVAFVIGIYDGIYGPGTGTFLIVLLTSLAHLNVQSANGVTKAINLSSNYAALAVYLLAGKAVILLGLTAGICNMAGNYLGTLYFQKGGAKSLKPVMVFVLIIFFIKVIIEQYF